MEQEIATTPRLRIRRIGGGDAPAMFAVYGDAAAMRYVGDGTPLSRAGCDDWVAVTHRNYATRGYGMFAVELRSTGEIIGFCGLVHPGGQPEAEIKYAFQRAHWGHGYATEAATALVAYGESALHLAEIIATVDPAHHASQHVLAKAGLRKAELREDDDGSLTQVFRWRKG